MTNPTYCKDCKNAPSHRDRQHIPGYSWKCKCIGATFVITNYVTGIKTTTRYVDGAQRLCIDLNHGECSRFERR